MVGSNNRFQDLLYQTQVVAKLLQHTRNGFSFLWAHLLGRKRLFLLKLRQGYRMMIRPVDADATMIMESWGFQVYTPPPLDIRPSDIVVDIGAHIGSFTSFAATQASEGRVFAFEPLPANFKLLQRNIHLNKLTNAKIEQKAIAAKKGTSVLHLYEGPHTGSSSLYRRNSDRTISIETTTLPLFMKENRLDHIDLLKLDCEGAEYEILFSLPRVTLRKISRITMEYHDAINEHRHSELVAFLQQKGFLVWVQGENLYAVNQSFSP